MAFDQRDVLASLRGGGPTLFPVPQGASAGAFKSKAIDDFDQELLQLSGGYTPYKSQQASSTMSPQQPGFLHGMSSGNSLTGSFGPTSQTQSLPRSTQNSLGSTTTGAIGGFGMSQQRVGSPLGSAVGGSGGGFQQSMFQQPPQAASPTRMLRQMQTAHSTSNLGGLSSTTLGGSVQQQQQPQQRLGFGSSLFGGTGNSLGSTSQQSQQQQQQPSFARPGTTSRQPGSSLIDLNDFPALAPQSGSSTSTAGQSGSVGLGSSASSMSSSRLMGLVNSAGNSGGGSTGGFPGFTPAQTAAAAALANKFGVSPAALASSLLAGFNQQSSSSQLLTPNQLMSAGALGASAGDNMQQPSGFRMAEEDFPALKPTAAPTTTHGTIGGIRTMQDVQQQQQQATSGLTTDQQALSIAGDMSLQRMAAIGAAPGSGRVGLQVGSLGGGIASAVSASGSSIITGSTPSGIVVDADGNVCNIPMGLVADSFGLVGLLSFMKTSPASMLDPASSAIAVGLALTELGLKLSVTENIHPWFTSPWHDAGSKPHDLDCAVPPEYLVSLYQPQQFGGARGGESGSGPIAGGLSRTSQNHLIPVGALKSSPEDLLFYLFYTCCGDALQLAAASELYRRHWRYHRRLEMWLLRVDAPPHTIAKDWETGIYDVFDHRTWKRERREQRIDFRDFEATDLQIFPQQGQQPPIGGLPGTGVPSAGGLVTGPSGNAPGQGGHGRPFF